MSINYSNIEGGWDYQMNDYYQAHPCSGPCEGIIASDPEFNEDYTLQASSPCIDAGDPSSDLDPDGTRADMGVYPFFHIWGCTDTNADNFDMEANTNNGSCMYRPRTSRPNQALQPATDLRRIAHKTFRKKIQSERRPGAYTPAMLR